VCAAQTGSLSPDAAARVIALTGQVSVLRDSQPWALGVGSSVRLQQLIVTGPDGFAEFQVSDGSTFKVFPNSRVIFRNNPGNWKDLLDMLVGRVKVHIQKWGGQPNHNNVRTPTAVISVRGTIFDVAIEDEDDTTFVLVEEGQVAVAHRIKVGEPKLLNSGEWLRVYRDQPLAQKSIDKGSVLRAALRAAAEAIYSTIYNNPRAQTGPTPPAVGGGPGVGLPTDTEAPPPPPAPGGDPGAPPPPPPPEPED
jgi:ferric-dicitrate binding protein FerR (iron transport regulator)